LKEASAGGSRKSDPCFCQFDSCIVVQGNNVNQVRYRGGLLAPASSQIRACRDISGQVQEDEPTSRRTTRVVPLAYGVRPPHRIEGMVGVVAAGRRPGLPARRVAGAGDDPAGCARAIFSLYRTRYLGRGIPPEWSAPLHDVAAEHPNRLPPQILPTPPINFISTMTTLYRQRWKIAVTLEQQLS
jgi:hypothetical protein